MSMYVYAYFCTLQLYVHAVYVIMYTYTTLMYNTTIVLPTQILYNMYTPFCSMVDSTQFHI